MKRNNQKFYDFTYISNVQTKTVKIKYTDKNELLQGIHLYQRLCQNKQFTLRQFEKLSFSRMTKLISGIVLLYPAFHNDKPQLDKFRKYVKQILKIYARDQQPWSLNCCYNFLVDLINPDPYGPIYKLDQESLKKSLKQIKSNINKKTRTQKTKLQLIFNKKEKLIKKD